MADAPRPKALEYSRGLRQLLHRRLIESIEADELAGFAEPGNIRERIAELIEQLQEERFLRISDAARTRVEREIIEEVGGMGPLATLMMDPAVSDILVNGPEEIFVDRHGRLERTGCRFDDEAHLKRFVDRLVAANGRRLDAASPIVDARLSDGSRLHAVIPPLSPTGVVVSIRRFRPEAPTLQQLIDEGFCSRDMLRVLKAAVATRANVVVSGGASAGKTTFLNVLSRFIPAAERLVTIEETAELRLEHEHVVGLEGREPNVEGQGGVTLRELVRAALRMRADRIIVGEVRGAEVFEMLQAMNVGHDGSLTTVHANSSGDVLRRLEALVMMGSLQMTRDAIREMVASAIELVVHVSRFSDGRRRISSILEVRQREDGQAETRELFRFVPECPGSATGRHVAVEPPRSLAARLGKGSAPA